MNAPAQQILLAFLGICSLCLLLFLIVGIWAPHYKDVSERNGLTVQAHPEDHRDYVFRGQDGSASREFVMHRDA